MNDLRTGAPRHPALIYGPAMLVSLIGLGDSIYLTIQHLTGQSVRCTVTTGCSAVLSSHYATVAGVPTAAFGAFAYFAAFSLATMMRAFWLPHVKSSRIVLIFRANATIAGLKLKIDLSREEKHGSHRRTFSVGRNGGVADGRACCFC